MKRRFLTKSAVMLLLLRQTAGGQEILLQKRQNTGFCDGYYDFSASGHVEDQESMKMAMCREAKEELAIELTPEDLDFVCLIHKRAGGDIYYNGYFKAAHWLGEPTIHEPEKIEALKWFPVTALPENLIDDRKEAIQNYIRGVSYSEYGWPGSRTI